MGFVPRSVYEFEAETALVIVEEGDAQMWVNRDWFTSLLAERDRYFADSYTAHAANERLIGEHLSLKQQKARDDIALDWMRHRINALEKQNAALLMKIGIPVPVPEIISDRPGTISPLPESLQFMPSFEDVGDQEAAQLGVQHDEDGTLIFTK